jgi:hypothetical protein
MCIDHGDHPEDIHDFMAQDDFARMGPDELEEVEILGAVVNRQVPNDVRETNTRLLAAGTAKRDQLLQELLNDLY